MAFNWIDIVMLVLSGICFLILLWAVDDLIVDGDAVFPAIVAGVICAVLCIGALFDGAHRVQDNQAKSDFNAAGYSYIWVNRLHAELPFGSCRHVFDVRKIEGVYRPVVRIYKPGQKHQKHWVALAPEWFKQTHCPA